MGQTDVTFLQRSISKLDEKVRQQEVELDSLRKGGSQPPSGGGGLEKRIETLEKAIPEIREKLVRAETKLDSIEKTMATKTDLEALRGSISADIHKAINDQTWKFIGVATALAGLAFAAARFTHGG